MKGFRSHDLSPLHGLPWRYFDKLRMKLSSWEMPRKLQLHAEPVEARKMVMQSIKGHAGAGGAERDLEEEVRWSGISSM
jgi:hypothetical protein